MVHLRSVSLGVAAFLLGTSLAAPTPRPLPHNPASGGLQVPSTHNPASSDIVNLAARFSLFGGKKNYVVKPSPEQLLNAKLHDQAVILNLQAAKSSTAVANAHRSAAGHFLENSPSNANHLLHATVWDNRAASHRENALHHHVTAESSRAGMTNIHTHDRAQMSSIGAIVAHKEAQNRHALLNVVFPPAKLNNQSQHGQHRPAAAPQSKSLFSKVKNLARTAWRAVTPGKHK